MAAESALTPPAAFGSATCSATCRLGARATACPAAPSGLRTALRHAPASPSLTVRRFMRLVQSSRPARSASTNCDGSPEDPADSQADAGQATREQPQHRGGNHRPQHIDPGQRRTDCDAEYQKRGDQRDGDKHSGTTCHGPARARERCSQQHLQSAGCLIGRPAGHERGGGKPDGEEADLDDAELQQPGGCGDVKRKPLAEKPSGLR
jgi:hypothetical protein